MVVWNRYLTEWAATGAYAVLAAVFAAVAVQASRRRLLPGLQSPAVPLSAPRASLAATAIPPFSTALAAVRRHGLQSAAPLQWLSLLRIVFLFGGAAMGLLLIFDARYRGFPMPLYALPVMSLLLLMAAGFRTSVFEREEAVLATIMLVCALAIIPLERLSNLQAMMFSLQLIVLAGAATGFRYWRFRPRRGQLEPQDLAGA
jgi:glucan 1,3-beta-glucosidase